MGMTTQIVNKLLPLGIQCKTFTNVEPDPTLAMVERCAPASLCSEHCLYWF
jgi:alcohol dehydrogenase class IV